MKTTYVFKSIVKEDMNICHVKLILIFLRQQLNANICCLFQWDFFSLLLGKGVSQLAFLEE